MLMNIPTKDMSDQYITDGFSRQLFYVLFFFNNRWVDPSEASFC